MAVLTGTVKMEQINQHFDKLLDPLARLDELCAKLPCGDKKTRLLDQIAAIKEQNEQAKRELKAFLSN